VIFEVAAIRSFSLVRLVARLYPSSLQVGLANKSILLNDIEISAEYFLSFIFYKI